MEDNKLIAAAIQAKENAYAPYSHFRVGAALLTENGTIYTGCNIENAAYSPSLCAERTAIAKAVSEGCQEFLAIAITGDSQSYLAPCGVCRQVLAEFCDMKNFRVILAKNTEDYQVYRLGELLPCSFGKESLNR